MKRFIILIWVLIGLPLSTLSAQPTSSSYICTPCDAFCDTLPFAHQGVCPHCKMPLLSLDSIGRDYQALHPPVVLKADFSLLRTALEAAHPALYWHRSKDAIDARFEEGFTALDHPMTVADFYKIVRRTIAAIGDVHMSTYLPGAFTAWQSRKGVFLPLDITYVRGKAYITANHSEEPGLVAGSKLVRLNDQSIEPLTNYLFDYVVADNNRKTTKYKTLSQAFSQYYHDYNAQPERFEVEILSGGKRKIVTVKAMSWQALEQHRLHHAASQTPISPSAGTHSSKTLSVQFLPGESTAVLRIKSFSDVLIRRDGQEYEGFIDCFFEETAKRGIKHLIIDIRGNRGGNSGNGAYLFSHLTDHPFTVDQTMEAKSIPIKYWDFSGVRDSQGKPVVLHENDYFRTSQGTYQIKEYPSLKPVNPQAKPFANNVYVLIDGLVESEASSFASVVDHHKRGVLIGEETGGDYNGNTGGTWANLTLPNSQVRIQMFVFKKVRFSDPLKASHGVVPRYIVQPSAEDVLAKRDAELAAALALVRSGQTTGLKSKRSAEKTKY